MPKRDQTALISQLKLYLSLLAKDSTPELNLPSNGMCFGLSVCRSAMRVSGKLAWWDAAIDQILLWNGQKSSLYEELVLPDQGSQQNIPLQALFERIINYIVFNHAIYKYLPLSQYRLLMPGQLFNLLNNKEVQQIEESYRIAGHFFTNDLIRIFDEEDTIEAVKNNICILTSLNHACELGWLDGRWYLYDPESSKGAPRFFETSKELAEEIFMRLGKDISIQLACFTKLQNKPFQAFNTLATRHTERLASQNGFLTIAKWHTSSIPQILDTLNVDIVASLINQTDGYGWSALMFAGYNNDPQAVHAICAAGANPNQIIPKNGYTPLILAARSNASDSIKQLYTDGADLNQTDKSGDTALIHAVKRNAIDAVKTLCEFNLNPLLRCNGVTALHYAIVLENTDIFLLLLKKAGPLPRDIYSEVQAAATHFKKIEVLAILESQNLKFGNQSQTSTFFKTNSVEPNVSAPASSIIKPDSPSSSGRVK